MLILVFHIGSFIVSCWRDCLYRWFWLCGAHAAACTVKMALRCGDGVGHVVRDHLGCKTRVSDKPVATDCIKERGNRRRSEAGVRETDVVCVEVMEKYKVGLATHGLEEATATEVRWMVSVRQG